MEASAITVQHALLNQGAYLGARNSCNENLGKWVSDIGCATSSGSCVVEGSEQLVGVFADDAEVMAAAAAMRRHSGHSSPGRLGPWGPSSSYSLSGFDDSDDHPPTTVPIRVSDPQPATWELQRPRIPWTPQKPQQHSSTAAATAARSSSVFAGGTMLSMFGFRLGALSWMRGGTDGWLKRIDNMLPIEHPRSLRRQYWDIGLLLFVLYNALSVPFDVSYGMPSTPGLARLDIVVEVLFVLDVLYNLRTGFIDKHGNIIYSSTMIFKKYLSSWFLIDILACLPLDLFSEWLGVAGNDMQMLAFLRVPRLLRLGRLLRFLEKMKKANILKVVRLLAAMFVMAHWVACAWFVLYKYNKSLRWMFTGMQHWSKASQYCTAFYKSLLLILGENLVPHNNIERAFYICVMVLGSAFYAVVVGHMLLLISSATATGTRNKRHKDLALDAMHYYKLPRGIQQRVEAYLDYTATYSHPGQDGIDALLDLPRDLHEDICTHRMQATLDQVCIFQGCEQAFLTQVAVNTGILVFLAGETIFSVGDFARGLFMITKGKVALTNCMGEMIDLLAEHSSLGEEAAMFGSRYTINATAVCSCEVAVLPMHQLQLAMKHCPRSAQALRNNVMDALNTQVWGATAPANAPTTSRPACSFGSAQHTVSPAKLHTTATAPSKVATSAVAEDQQHTPNNVATSPVAEDEQHTPRKSRSSWLHRINHTIARLMQALPTGRVLKATTTGHQTTKTLSSSMSTTAKESSPRMAAGSAIRVSTANLGRFQPTHQPGQNLGATLSLLDQHQMEVDRKSQSDNKHLGWTAHLESEFVPYGGGLQDAVRGFISAKCSPDFTPRVGGNAPTCALPSQISHSSKASPSHTPPRLEVTDPTGQALLQLMTAVDVLAGEMDRMDGRMDRLQLQLDAMSRRVSTPTRITDPLALGLTTAPCNEAGPAGRNLRSKSFTVRSGASFKVRNRDKESTHVGAKREALAQAM